MPDPKLPSRTEPATQDVNVPPPARLEFTEHPLPEEPDGDRKLVAANGRVLRERMIEHGARAENVASDAASPTAFSVLISHAALDASDSVVMRDGKPLIAPAHEFVLTLNALGRLETEEAVEAAIQDAREVAAAEADRVFRGAELADMVLSRTRT